MKQLKVTIESRAYSEEEAKEFLDNFKKESKEKGYIVGANGYTYKSKKAKGMVVGEGWNCKCTAIYDSFWDEDE